MFHHLSLCCFREVLVQPVVLLVPFLVVLVLAFNSCMLNVHLPVLFVPVVLVLLGVLVLIFVC